MLQKVCQSYGQKLYFKNSKFKTNVDCDLVKVAEKTFQVKEDFNI